MDDKSINSMAEAFLNALRKEHEQHMDRIQREKQQALQECNGEPIAYIIQPLCHGNGGWCGSEVMKVCKSVDAALKLKPRWRPEYSPYDGHVMNDPCLSLTEDPNDAIYVFDMEETYQWKGVTPYKMRETS